MTLLKKPLVGTPPRTVTVHVLYLSTGILFFCYLPFFNIFFVSSQIA